MSLQVTGLDEPFTVRVFKTWTLDPEKTWVNTYEIISNAIGTQADLIDAANDIVAFEQAIHTVDTTFDRYTISTFNPDSTPYDEFAFLTNTLSGIQGLRTGSSDAVDLRVTLNVAKEVAYGRNGKLAYRGCLFENDISANSGVYRLTDASPVKFDFNTAVTTYLSSHLSLGNPEPVSLALVRSSGLGTVRREVVTLTLKGVSITSRRHRYYDRA